MTGLEIGLIIWTFVNTLLFLMLFASTIAARKDRNTLYELLKKITSIYDKNFEVTATQLGSIVQFLIQAFNLKESPVETPEPKKAKPPTDMLN